MNAAPVRRGAEPTHYADLFPNREQALVLQAALGDGEQALAAYHEWKDSLDLAGDFDRGVFRLVPLLYENLRRLGYRDELTGRLKGAYRMAWARNHQVFEQTRPILDAFLERGLSVMAIKGAPIALQYYGNVAVRPMSDVDLVVPTDQAAAAAELLGKMGYVPWRPFDCEVQRYRHAMAFYAPGPREFDLHWHVLFDVCNEFADRFFWASARPFHFLGHDLVAPDATRMLVHTIIHGIRWNQEPPVRWIPDAVMILRSASASLDWQSLVAFAVSQRIARRLYMGLSYLDRAFGAEIPEWVLDRLGGHRRTLVEWVEDKTVLRPFDYASGLGPVLEALAEYPGLRNSSGTLGAFGDFSHFLRYHWGLGGRREIPKRLVEGVARRARRLATGTGAGSP